MSGETLVIISIILQAVSIYYAIRISKLLGYSLFWNLFIFALALGPIRRFITLFDYYAILSTLPPSTIVVLKTLDKLYIPLLSAMCFAVGMHTLYEKIENNNLIKKQKSIKRK